MPFRDVFTWHLQVFGKPEGRYLHSGEEAVYFFYFLSDSRYQKADETNERNLINQPIQHPQTIYLGSCNRSVTWSLSLPQGLRPVSMLLWLPKHLVCALYTINNSQQRICWVSISGAGDWWHENARPAKPEQSWNLAGTFRCRVAKRG